MQKTSTSGKFDFIVAADALREVIKIGPSN